MGYPADLGTGEGRIVIDADAPTLDGDAYTLAGVSRPVPTVPPAITALTPNSVAHTADPLRVVVSGSDFMHGDVVMFGGATYPTEFVSDDELAIEIDPGDWSPGVLKVFVVWSSRGPSNTVDFTVT